MMHHAPFGILIVVAALGTIGNVLIIGAVCIYKRLRVKSHVFILNLAVVDLLVTAYIMPVGLATSQFSQNPFGTTMCDLNAFLIMTCCGVSTQTLMAIALERYFHICRISLYRRLFTNKLLTFYVIFIWLYTILWTSQGFTAWTEYKYSEIMYICIFDGEESRTYNICLAIVGMIIPMVVVAICYCLIFRTVRRGKKALEVHRKRINSTQSNDSNNNNKDSNGNSTPNLANLQRQQHMNRREYQFVLTLFVIVVLFILSWLPAAFVLTFSGFSDSLPDILWPISIWLAFSNSSINSIVYGVMNRHFRTGYLELLQYTFCCKSCKCNTCSMYHRSKSEDSLNSQSRLAHAYFHPSCSPTSRTNFRFPSSNRLKGYGTRTDEPIYHNVVDRHQNSTANGDIRRIKSKTSVDVSTSPPKQEEDLYENLDAESTPNKEEDTVHENIENAGMDLPSSPVTDPWSLPDVGYRIPEPDYIYGAFSSGNSSIITIESNISDDSEYDKRQSLENDKNDNDEDVLKETEHIYDIIGNIHSKEKIVLPARKTSIINLRNDGFDPIYEVPIPEAEGEIIMPTQVERTPVLSRKKKSKKPQTDCTTENLETAL